VFEHYVMNNIINTDIMEKYIVVSVTDNKYTLTLDSVHSNNVVTVDFKFIDNDNLTYTNTMIFDEKLLARLEKSITKTDNFDYRLRLDEDTLTLTIFNAFYDTKEIFNFMMNEESKKLNNDPVNKLLVTLSKKLTNLENPIFKQVFMIGHTDCKERDIFMKMLSDYMNTNITDYKENINKIIKSSTIKFSKKSCEIKNSVFHSLNLQESSLTDCLKIQLHIKHMIMSRYTNCPHLMLQKVLLDQDSKLLCSHLSGDYICNECKRIKALELKNNCIKQLHTISAVHCSCYYLIASCNGFGINKIGDTCHNKIEYDSSISDCHIIMERDIEILETLKYYELILNALSSNGYHALDITDNIFNDCIKCTFDMNSQFNYEIVLLNKIDDDYYNIYDWKKEYIKFDDLVYISESFPIKLNLQQFNKMHKRYVIYRTKVY
jgi:hypothetical protein